ncbi:MAG: hypothetical protein IJQ82_12885 [Selenomonadaceae bacterium]|nr:hypothetical protein [Selenomonadaceae bacterium]
MTKQRILLELKRNRLDQIKFSLQNKQTELENLCRQPNAAKKIELIATGIKVFRIGMVAEFSMGFSLRFSTKNFRRQSVVSESWHLEKFLHGLSFALKTCLLYFFGGLFSVPSFLRPIVHREKSSDYSTRKLSCVSSNLPACTI